MMKKRKSKKEKEDRNRSHPKSLDGGSREDQQRTKERHFSILASSKNE